MPSRAVTPCREHGSVARSSKFGDIVKKAALFGVGGWGLLEGRGRERDGRCFNTGDCLEVISECKSGGDWGGRIDEIFKAEGEFEGGDNLTSCVQQIYAAKNR